MYSVCYFICFTEKCIAHTINGITNKMFDVDSIDFDIPVFAIVAHIYYLGYRG